MPRAARFELPDYPHHVTQRGNRRQQTIFRDEGYALYLGKNGDTYRFPVTDTINGCVFSISRMLWGMPRRARIVLPGYPHHVTQRGNRRQQTFFETNDYALYRDLMAAACAEHGVRCWAWCLMPNHVHLVLEPSRAEALASAVGEAHRRYTRRINALEGWTDFLWQGRSASCAMDEGYALAAINWDSGQNHRANRPDT